MTARPDSTSRNAVTIPRAIKIVPMVRSTRGVRDDDAAPMNTSPMPIRAAASAYKPVDVAVYSPSNARTSRGDGTTRPTTPAPIMKSPIRSAALFIADLPDVSLVEDLFRNSASDIHTTYRDFVFRY